MHEYHAETGVVAQAAQRVQESAIAAFELALVDSAFSIAPPVSNLAVDTVRPIDIDALVDRVRESFEDGGGSTNSPLIGAAPERRKPPSNATGKRAILQLAVCAVTKTGVGVKGH